MNPSIIQRRKNLMAPDNLYFWTATIHNWIPLLEPDYRKEIIMQSLSWLKSNGLAEIYAYVIMPNHMPLIWQTNPKEGKETVAGTLLKNTAHMFKKNLRQNARDLLPLFKVMANNKQNAFWQRDSLAIKLFTRKVACQKVNYLHQNPVGEKLREDTHRGRGLHRVID